MGTAQSISDAVAISRAVSAEVRGSCTYSRLSNRWLSVSCLKDFSYACGAIVKGHLYHDDNTVFGEALVRAYMLERDVVRYPRIMVTRDVAIDLLKFARSDAQFRHKFENYVHDSDDGPSFLNVLRRVSSDVEDALETNADVDFEEDEELAYYGEIRNRIQQRFIQSKDNPHHFEKVVRQVGTAASFP